MGVRQPRRAARARPGLRCHVRGPACDGAPPGVLSRPWTSPVYFAADGLTTYYWCSTADSQHSLNLARNDTVSLVVFDSTVPPYTGRAVYASGVAAQVMEGELDDALSVYPGPEARGGSSLDRDDVSADSPWRVWRAVASAAWVLCPRERGRPCDLHGRSDDHRAAVVP